MESELYEKLVKILNNDSENDEILNQNDLHHAFIYCKINNINCPASGTMLEKYIKTKYEFTGASNETAGDVCGHSSGIEIKISLGGKLHNKFNYVQLRMNHDCSYVLIAYYLSKKNVKKLGEVFIFRIEKEQLKSIILKYGGYAHGTIKKLGPITIEDLNNDNNNKEYAIRPKYDDKCWIELMRYRIHEIDLFSA